jgi:large subunit ribosomal protein L9
MKVVLRKNFESLGEAGQIVGVKDGYARNFLIPRGIAYEASARNLSLVQEAKRQSEHRQTREQHLAEDLRNKLSEVSITATVSVGEDDKVFGSVTSQEIARLLAEKGFEIDRRKIILDEPIKMLGVFEIPIKLHSKVEAKIKVWVVKE